MNTYCSVSDQPLEGTLHSEVCEAIHVYTLIYMWRTFDNQGHDGVGDAERVAGNTTVGAVVHRANSGDGYDRAVGADFNVICRGEEQIKHVIC